MRERIGRLIRAGFGTKSLLLLVLLVCVVVPTTMIAWQIHDNPQLSLIDEGAHLDYLLRVSKFEMPRMGQTLSQRDLRLTVCAGVNDPGLKLPSCHAALLRPSEFPAGGYQYEAQQPPTYYAATAVMRSVNQHLFGVSNYITSGRLTGIVWLAFGLLLLWFAGRLFRVDPWAMLAALFLLAVAPNVIYYSSIISNDAAAVFAGGLLAFVTGLALRRPSRFMPWILGAAAFVAVALKTTNLIAVAALSLFLLVQQFLDNPEWRSKARDLARAFMRTGGALVIGGAIALIGWTVANRAIDLVNPSTLPVFRGRPLPGGGGVRIFLSEATSLLSPVSGSTASKTFSDAGQTLFIQLTTGLFLAAGLAGLIARRTWATVLGLCTVVALIVVGFGLGVLIYLSYREDPGVESRYALSAAPILALCIGNGASTRLQRLGVAAVGVGMLASTIYAFTLY